MPQSYQNANLKPGMRRRPAPSNTPSPTAAALAALKNKQQIAVDNRANLSPPRQSPASADNVYQYQLKQLGGLQQVNRVGGVSPPSAKGYNINNIINRGNNSPQPPSTNQHNNYVSGGANNNAKQGIAIGAGAAAGNYAVRRPQDGNVRNLPIQQFSFTPVPTHGHQAGVLMQPTPSPRAAGQINPSNNFANQQPYSNFNRGGVVDMNPQQRPMGDISSAHVLDDRIRARMREGGAGSNNLNRHNNVAVAHSAELQRYDPSVPQPLFKGNFVLPSDGSAAQPPLNRYQQKQQDIQHTLILRQMELLKQKQQLQDQQMRQVEYQQLQQIAFQQPAGNGANAQPPYAPQQPQMPSANNNHVQQNVVGGRAKQQQHQHQNHVQGSPEAVKRTIPITLRAGNEEAQAAANKKGQMSPPHPKGSARPAADQESIYNLISDKQEEAHEPSQVAAKAPQEKPSPPPHVNLDEIIRNYTALNPTPLIPAGGSPVGGAAGSNPTSNKSSPIRALDAAALGGKSTQQQPPIARGSPSPPLNSKQALALQLQAQNVQAQNISPLKPAPIVVGPVHALVVGAASPPPRASVDTTPYGQQLQRLIASVFPHLAHTSPTSTPRQAKDGSSGGQNSLLPLPPLAYEIVYCSSETLPATSVNPPKESSVSTSAAAAKNLGKHSAMELIKAVEGQWKVYSKEFPKVLERALQAMPPPEARSGKSPTQRIAAVGATAEDVGADGGAAPVTVSATSALSDGWYTAPAPIAAAAPTKVSATAEGNSTPLAEDLTDHSADKDAGSPHSEGGAACYPVELILRFPSGDVDVSQLQLLVHETKIPTRVEVRVFSLTNHWARLIAKKDEKKAKKENKRNTPPPVELPVPSALAADQLSSMPLSELIARYPLPSYKEVKFQKLGSVAFSNNEKTKFKAKERKTIHLDGQKAYYLKLIFSAPYVNHHNNDSTPHLAATGEDVASGGEAGAIGGAAASGIITGTQIGLYSVLCMGSELPRQKSATGADLPPLRHVDAPKYSFTAAVPAPYNWLKVMVGAEAHKHKEELAKETRRAEEEAEAQRQRMAAEELERSRKEELKLMKANQSPEGLVSSPGKAKPTTTSSVTGGALIDEKPPLDDIVIANRDIRSGGGIGIGGLGGKKGMLRGSTIGGPLSLRATQESPNLMAQSSIGTMEGGMGSEGSSAPHLPPNRGGRSSIVSGHHVLAADNNSNEADSFSNSAFPHHPKPVGPVAGIEALDPTEDERMFMQLHKQAKGGIAQPIHSPMESMAGGGHNQIGDDALKHLPPALQLQLLKQHQAQAQQQQQQQQLLQQGQPTKQQKVAAGRRSSMDTDGSKPPIKALGGKKRSSPQLLALQQQQQQPIPSDLISNQPQQLMLPPVVTPFRSLPLQQFEPFLLSAVGDLAELKQNAIARESFEEAQFYKDQLVSIERESSRIYELETLKVNAIYSEDFTFADKCKREMNRRMESVRGLVTADYTPAVTALPPLREAEMGMMGNQHQGQHSKVPQVGRSPGQSAASPPPRSYDKGETPPMRSPMDRDSEDEISGDTERIGVAPAPKRGSNPNASNLILQDDQPVLSKYAQKMADERRKKESDRQALQVATDALPPTTPHNEKKLKRSDDGEDADGAAAADSDNGDGADGDLSHRGPLGETSPPRGDRRRQDDRPDVSEDLPKLLPKPQPQPQQPPPTPSPTPSLSAQQQANPNSFYSQWEQPVVDLIHNTVKELRRGGAAPPTGDEDASGVIDSSQATAEAEGEDGFESQLLGEDEPLLAEPAAARTESQPLTSSFGSYAATCLLSKRWRLREAALIVIRDNLGSSLFSGSAAAVGGTNNPSSSNIGNNGAGNTTPNIAGLEVSNDDAYLYTSSCRSSIYAFLMYANVKSFGLTDPVASCGVATCGVLQNVLLGRYRKVNANSGTEREDAFASIRDKDDPNTPQVDHHNGSNANVLFCAGALLSILPRVVARAVAPAAAPLNSFGKASEPSLLNPGLLLPPTNTSVKAAGSRSSSTNTTTESAVTISAAALQTLFGAYIVAIGADRTIAHGILADPMDADKRKLPNPAIKIQMNRLNLLSLLFGIAFESLMGGADRGGTVAAAKLIVSPAAAVTLVPPQSPLEQQLMAKLLIPTLNHPNNAVREVAVACTVKLLTLQGIAKGRTASGDSPAALESGSAIDHQQQQPATQDQAKGTSVSHLAAQLLKKYGPKIGGGSKNAIEELTAETSESPKNE